MPLLSWSAASLLSASTQASRGPRQRASAAAAPENRIRKLLRARKGILKVAREVGVGTATVQRIKQEMTGPFADAAAS
jgi:DNA invertase Pin-like site-specific DNA recombinase